MEELIDCFQQMRKGGLLENEDFLIAFSLLNKDTQIDPITFTPQELAILYADCKARGNFAPEENLELENKLRDSIFNKIEKVYGKQ